MADRHSFALLQDFTISYLCYIITLPLDPLKHRSRWIPRNLGYTRGTQIIKALIEAGAAVDLRNKVSSGVSYY